MDDGLSSKRSRAQKRVGRSYQEAAVRVFSRDGFQGATTREIAREAGVNEVTIFRHFRTREELLHSMPLISFGTGSIAQCFDTQRMATTRNPSRHI
jgi:hypothetical protein